MLPRAYDDRYEVNEDAEAEIARELSFREFEQQMRFCATTRKWGWPALVQMAVDLMQDGLGAHGNDETAELQMADFAEEQGWPDVLRALARAMEAQ